MFNKGKQIHYFKWKVYITACEIPIFKTTQAKIKSDENKSIGTRCINLSFNFYEMRCAHSNSTINQPILQSFSVSLEWGFPNLVPGNAGVP